MYIVIINDMYNGVVTSFRMIGGETSEFPITIDLHQGLPLSLSFCFGCGGSKHIKEDVTWCILFVDYIILVDETRVWVNSSLEFWIDSLEFEVFRLSRTKTDSMKYKCNQTRNRNEGRVQIGG